MADSRITLNNILAVSPAALKVKNGGAMAHQRQRLDQAGQRLIPFEHQENGGRHTPAARKRRWQQGLLLPINRRRLCPSSALICRACARSFFASGFFD